MAHILSRKKVFKLTPQNHTIHNLSHVPPPSYYLYKAQCQNYRGEGWGIPPHWSVLSPTGFQFSFAGWDSFPPTALKYFVQETTPLKMELRSPPAARQKVLCAGDDPFYKF